MKDKILGKVEELRGRLTGDRGAQVRGRGRQAVGEVKRVGKELVYDAEHPRRPEDAQEPRT
jgi:uncharacterized protein YjbJ (UPF0337 family)